ncbi:MAG: Rpp14/Pop5 family protein [Candidatus Nanoarchaeia archaeon]
MPKVLKSKLKLSPPTVRERKRYLLLKVEVSKQINANDIENAIINSALQFLGEFGTAQASILVLTETWNGKTIILKCAHTFVDELKSVLALIKTIKESPARLSVLRVSGSVAKLKDLQKEISS